MKLITCDSLEIVSTSWDTTRFGPRGTSSDGEFGTIVLNKLFEIEPKARLVFEASSRSTSRDDGAHSIAIHVKVISSLFDSVLQLMGPDVEFAEEILRQVGLRHKSVGVDPRFFPSMGTALIHAIETLGDKALNPRERHAWEEVYCAISGEIVRAIVE